MNIYSIWLYTVCKCIVILHMTPSLCVTLFVNQPVTRCNFFWVKFDPYSNYSVSAQNWKISNTFQQKMNICICLITNIRLCVHVIVRMFVTYVPYVSLFTFPLSTLLFLSLATQYGDFEGQAVCVYVCVVRVSQWGLGVPLIVKDSYTLEMGLKEVAVGSATDCWTIAWGVTESWSVLQKRPPEGPIL